MLAQGEAGVGQLLLALSAQLSQAGRLGHPGRMAGQLHHRLPPPQTQSRSQGFHRPGEVALL